MKVALVIERFDPRHGGAEQWTWQFARWLLGQGHEVHVVAREFSGRGAALPVVPHCIPIGDRLRFAEAAVDRLQAVGADMVHDNGCGWHFDVFHAHGGSRQACFEHSLAARPRWLRPLKRAAARLSRRHRQFRTLAQRRRAASGLVVAVSDIAARQLMEYDGIPAARLRRVPNGVDVQHFAPAPRSVRQAVRRQLGVAPGEVLLLIVAHHFALKGVATLLEALQRLRAAGEHVRLAVVGGEKPGGWRRRADRLGVGPLVHWAGAVNDPRPFYAAADIYVHPTLYDPCSLVVLEAWASGLPVITSRCNGAAERMQPGVEGDLLHDPTDAEELFGRIALVLDPRTRRAMGEAGRALAQRHALEDNFRQMLAVYHEAGLRGGMPPAGQFSRPSFAFRSPDARPADSASADRAAASTARAAPPAWHSTSGMSRA